MIDEQLFSLDVKADQLRFFLEQIVAVVNGHSNSINAMQNDILRRLPARDVFIKLLYSSLNKP